MVHFYNTKYVSDFQINLLFWLYKCLWLYTYYIYYIGYEFYFTLNLFYCI